MRKLKNSNNVNYWKNKYWRVNSLHGKKDPTVKTVSDNLKFGPMISWEKRTSDRCWMTRCSVLPPPKPKHLSPVSAVYPGIYLSLRCVWKGPWATYSQVRFMTSCRLRLGNVFWELLVLVRVRFPCWFVLKHRFASDWSPPVHHAFDSLWAVEKPHSCQVHLQPHQPKQAAHFLCAWKSF